jgi:hypothetical protein
MVGVMGIGHSRGKTINSIATFELLKRHSQARSRGYHAGHNVDTPKTRKALSLCTDPISESHPSTTVGISFCSKGYTMQKLSILKLLECSYNNFWVGARILVLDLGGVDWECKRPVQYSFYRVLG